MAPSGPTDALVKIRSGHTDIAETPSLVDRLRDPDEVNALIVRREAADWIEKLVRVASACQDLPLWKLEDSPGEDYEAVSRLRGALDELRKSLVIPSRSSHTAMTEDRLAAIRARLARGGIRGREDVADLLADRDSLAAVVDGQQEALGDALDVLLEDEGVDADWKRTNAEKVSATIPILREALVIGLSASGPKEKQT